MSLNFNPNDVYDVMVISLYCSYPRGLCFLSRLSKVMLTDEPGLKLRAGLQIFFKIRGPK